MNPDKFAILLGTIRAVILNESAASVLLPMYDSAGDQVVNAFHAAGFSAEELMALERTLRLLRDALTLKTQDPPIGR